MSEQGHRHESKREEEGNNEGGSRSSKASPEDFCSDDTPLANLDELEQLRQNSLALSETCQKYFDLFDRAPVGYMALDTRLIVQDTNTMAAELLGKPPGSIKGAPLLAFITVDSRKKCIDHFEEVKMEGDGMATLILRGGVGLVPMLFVSSMSFLGGREMIRTVLFDVSETHS